MTPASRGAVDKVLNMRVSAAPLCDTGARGTARPHIQDSPPGMPHWPGRNTTHFVEPVVPRPPYADVLGIEGA